jgi:hypothetical protein
MAASNSSTNAFNCSKDRCTESSVTDYAQSVTESLEAASEAWDGVWSEQFRIRRHLDLRRAKQRAFRTNSQAS